MYANIQQINMYTVLLCLANLSDILMCRFPSKQFHLKGYKKETKKLSVSDRLFRGR